MIKNNYFKLTFFGVLFYFFCWLLFYSLKVNDLPIQSEDTLPAMFMPIAIIKEKSIYLDSYYDMLIKKYPHPDDKKQELGYTPFYLKKVDNHYLSAFPIITPILALPIYLIPILMNIEVTWELLIYLSRISSAFIVISSGLILYKLLLHWLDDNKAFLLSFIYLFGTINFASISQALWQHGSLELFTLLALLFLVNAKRNLLNLYLFGFTLGLAVLSRPTSALALVFLFAYTFRKYSIQGLLKVSWGLVIPTLFFVYYNQNFYQGISNQGYSNQIFDSWRTPFYLGFLGMWLSPSKGLLTYSPVFIFSLIGAYKLWKNQISDLAEDSLLFKFFFLIMFTHIIIVSMWKHWYGGWSFGYRMASDVIPYLILLLVPYLKSNIYHKTNLYFKVCIIWSVLVQFIGLAFFDGIWHAAYDKGYKDQKWLWSIGNSEIIFNIKRTLVKLGLMKPFLP